MCRYREPVTEPLTRIGAPPPGRKRKPWYLSRWMLLAAPVAAVALFVTGAVGFSLIAPRLKSAAVAIDPPFAPQPFSVSGFLTLDLGGFTWEKDPDVCTGWKGYDDIHLGTQVVITDPSGTTVAIGQL